MQPFCLQFGEEETLVSQSLFLQKSWAKADKVPPKELRNLEDSRRGIMGICPESPVIVPGTQGSGLRSLVTVQVLRVDGGYRTSRVRETEGGRQNGEKALRRSQFDEKWWLRRADNRLRSSALADRIGRLLPH